MKKEEKNEEKECFEIIDPDGLESLLASDTWRPGKAQPPLSTARTAWKNCWHNSFVRNLIFLAGGSWFALILASNEPFGAYAPTDIVRIILAIGAGVVSGVLVLLGSFIAFLAKEVYTRRK